MPHVTLIPHLLDPAAYGLEVPPAGGRRPLSREHAFGTRGGDWSAERTTMFSSYLVLNAVIVAIGVGLVILGHKVRSRQTTGRDTVAAG